MEGEFQDQGQLDQDLEEWLSPRGSQSVHGFFSEEEKQESIRMEYSATEGATMKNVSHKKGWNSGVVQAYVEPPPIPLIKGINDVKSDKDFVKPKFHRDLTSSTSYIYEFRVSLFENGDTEEFLLFVRNFNMNFAASGTLEMGTKIQ